MAFVSVDRRDDGVAVVRLDRPKVNALSVELLDELAGVAVALGAEPPGAVVVWGGERMFAAGADINDFVASTGADGVTLVGRDGARAISARFRRALDAVAAIPRAVIAAVTGVALGGGCELALACDFRVAADTAKLGQPEVRLGIIPGAGGTQRLARLVGPARAKDLILSGRSLDATEALAMGLVDRVVPAADVLATAVSWAAELAAGPVAAHGLAKRAVDQGLDGSLAAGLDLERELFGEVFTTGDAAAGVAAFLAGRGAPPPRFTGR